MTSTRPKPSAGLSLGCFAVEQGNGSKRPCKGYIAAETHLAIRAYCWYREITQSDFVATLLESEIEQLQQSGQLTPTIIALYREKGRKPPSSIAG